MSNVKVLTYASPNDPIIQDVCFNDNILHICATASLTEAMVNRFKEKQNVIAAKWFTDAILGNWMASSVKLEQYMYLSELVRKGSADNPDDNPVNQAVRRNKADVLLTIRMLAELGIKPSDLRECAQTKNEQVLSQVWEQLEKKDEQTKYFKRLDWFHFALKRQRPNSFRNMINERLMEKYRWDKEHQPEIRVNPVNLHVNQTIVLHGFYFLTPIQQLIFQGLKQAGTDIIFLQFYNSKFPGTFSFLKNILGEDNDWVSEDKWHVSAFRDEQSDLSADFLASLFEPNVHIQKPASNRISQIRYKNLYQWMQVFKNDTIDKNTAGETSVNHLTAAGENIQQRLQEFFPDESLSKRNFLSYPIGQYIMHLHKIWNQETKEQMVDINTLKECFLSPWLYVKESAAGEKKYASDYLHYLEMIKDFFPQSMTLKKWIENLDLLIKNIQDGPFLSHDLNSLPEHARFIDEIKNPIKKIGPYSIKKEDLEHIKTILELMNGHVKQLFREDKVFFTLLEYYNLLQKIWMGSLRIEDLQNHEKKLIKKLEEVFQYNRNPLIDREYHIEDIAEAVHVLLGASLDNKDDDDEPPTKRLIHLGSIAEIDGMIFEGKDIHVSGLDEFSFPKFSPTLPWPLTIKTVEKLRIKSPSLKALLLRENHKELIPRYLFFVLLSGTQSITLSWFKDWDGKQELERSIYLKLIEDLSVISREVKAGKVNLPHEQSEFLKDDTVNYEQSFSSYSEYALSELNLCKRRFFYSYIVQPYSVYQTDFHFSFLYSNLYKLLSQLGTDPALMMKQVFPYWSDFKREAKSRSALIFNTPFVLSRPFKYAGIQYKALSGLKYLVNPANSTKGWKRAWDNAGFKFEDDIDLLQAEPGPNCKYCPHEEFCPAARYAIDED
ncbi:hypothetical protein [Bacillus sp. MUM 13]|uniref:hypothetical protein n=1 Tax=Bacillus sp. MUM 13 TaxID=1678001 RepID=UPI0008F5E8F3|nr:hypothetical protein [Bacillus sp. MUM 13]OIK09733.1 hypothetical protein BIV59_16270 [Bacillus sp. MUM 13]